MRDCRFKDIAGKSGEGVHSIKFMGIAVVDTAMTAIFVYFLSKHMKWSFGVTLLAAFIIGEIAHWYFCVDTAMIKIINGMFGSTEEPLAKMSLDQ